MVSRHRWQHGRLLARALFGALVLATLVSVAAVVLGAAALAPVATLLAVLVVAVGGLLALREVRQLLTSRDEARVDELTGLPGRRAFLDTLRDSLGEGAPGVSPGVAEHGLLLVDLARFKVVNDALGTAVGDEVLRQAAERLAALLEPSVLLARLPGDEFAILLRGGGGEEAVEQAGHLLRDAFAAPFPVGAMSVTVDARVGAALYPQHAVDAAGLLQRAGVAAAQARSEDGHVHVYEPTVDGRRGDRLVTVEQLVEAVRSGQLVVHYQPQVDLRSGEVSGVEALVRWNHPTRGLLRPDSFLRLVEQAGLVRSLTEVVLGVAVADCRALWDSGRTVAVSVNLAAGNLLDPSLPDLVTGMVEQAGLPSSALRLEVSESALMADPVRANAVFTRLRALGIAVTVDEYGSGASSVGSLRHLAADALTLDRGLVRGAASDPGATAVVRCLVDLAHALGLRLIAAGVESEETLDLLAALGCDAVQGYHLAPPLPLEDLRVWLDRWRDGARPLPRAGVPAGAVAEGSEAGSADRGMLSQLRSPQPEPAA